MDKFRSAIFALISMYKIRGLCQKGGFVGGTGRDKKVFKEWIWPVAGNHYVGSQNCDILLCFWAF